MSHFFDQKEMKCDPIAACEIVEDTVQLSNLERRNSARTPLCMVVRYGNNFMWAWDIGMGGLQCRTEAPLFPGRYLDIEFTIPGFERFEVGAQVTTLDSAPDGTLNVGIKFCRPSRRLRLGIFRFLDSRRYLWDEEVMNPEPEAFDPEGHNDTENTRSLEPLLLEAFVALRRRELAQIHGPHTHSTASKEEEEESHHPDRLLLKRPGTKSCAGGC